MEILTVTVLFYLIVCFTSSKMHKMMKSEQTTSKQISKK